MQSVLKNLHAMPGIIGGLLADANGSLLVHTFPPLFDVSALQKVCVDVNNSLVGMQDATGGVKLLDLRFEHGRVIVKQMPTYFLLLLCEQRVNLPLLLISINVAVKNLEPLVAAHVARVADAACAAKSKPVEAVSHQVTAVTQSEKGETPSSRLNKIVESSMSSGMI